MKRLAAAATAALFLQALSAFAEGLSEDLINDLPSATVIKSADDGSVRKMRPTLNSSEIAAIQYHEAASSRCQTRAGIFAIYPLRPTDTTCVANGLPGFVLP
jgi:hypothetical protein